MKTISCFAFVTLLCFVDFTSSSKLPQIKVLGIQHCCSNEDYLKGTVFYLTNYNKTYNHVHLYVNILQDIPSDAVLQFKVYATNDTFQDGELVMKNSIPICQESAMRELLPSALYVKKELFGTGESCFPKGVYKYEDLGQLRIEVMMPDIGKKGKFFRVDNMLFAGSTEIISVTFYTQLYNSIELKKLK